MTPAVEAALIVGRWFIWTGVLLILAGVLVGHFLQYTDHNAATGWAAFCGALGGSLLSQGAIQCWKAKRGLS